MLQTTTEKKIELIELSHAVPVKLHKNADLSIFNITTLASALGVFYLSVNSNPPKVALLVYDKILSISELIEFSHTDDITLEYTALGSETPESETLQLQIGYEIYIRRMV